MVDSDSPKASRTVRGGLQQYGKKGKVLFFERKYFRRNSESENSICRKEVLRHTYQPETLPHRNYERDQLSFNLVEALKGHIPSNMILLGVIELERQRSQDTFVINFKERVNQ